MRSGSDAPQAESEASGGSERNRNLRVRESGIQAFSFFLVYRLGNPSLVEIMKAEEFQASAPGRLVPTTGGALAFVPNPLPEHLPLGKETVGLLARAENALGRLAGTTSGELNPYLVGSPMLHREAILSSRIEGTVTTPEQLVLIRGGTNHERRSPADDDTREVLNYVDAIRHGLQRLRELPVCLRLVREIHQVLLAGVRSDQERPGEFRTHQNFVRGPLDETIENARLVPPPPRQMARALDELENYLNEKPALARDPILVQLALIHYQFETIHPFRDGNGRVGRLLIPLLLCGHGRLESPTLYLSAFFEKNRNLYVDLLLHVSRTGEWAPWVNFFLQGVLESAEEAIGMATNLLSLRQNYHRQFQTGRSSALLMKLIDRLFQTPSITIRDAAEHLGVSQQAASNNIRRLEAAGILKEVTGRRRNQIFLADEIMGFMYDRPPTGLPPREGS